MATRKPSERAIRLSNYNVNYLSTKTLARVLGGTTLESALERYRATTISAEVAFVCYETVRYYYSISSILQGLLHSPAEKLDKEIWCLLLVSACRLKYSRTPKHAIVSSAVDAARKIGKGSASGLVNAVLRKFDANSPPSGVEAIYEAPIWLIDLMKEAYGDRTDEILRISNTRAPMSLRINNRKISEINFRAMLDAADIKHDTGCRKLSVRLSKPCKASSLPGYAEGLFDVQDESSQLAVPLLQANPNDRILDACAAPGQKTRQISDLYPDNHLVSVDIRPERSTWNGDNTSLTPRLPIIEQGDVTTTSWWDGSPFQRVLLDAPCSGTGTLRRHPDIKVTRTEHNVCEAAKVQLSMLHSLWRTLDKNGQLLYCTCSILPIENDSVIETFLSCHQDAETDQLELGQGHATQFGWQVLPIENGGDGFYFSRLRKS